MRFNLCHTIEENVEFLRSLVGRDHGERIRYARMLYVVFICSLVGLSYIASDSFLYSDNQVSGDQSSHIHEWYCFSSSGNENKLLCNFCDLQRALQTWNWYILLVAKKARFNFRFD